tara:strand:- start:75010 stop:75609 length:600 start_codon:yes stop_codon:yes gene_type:complete
MMMKIDNEWVGAWQAIELLSENSKQWRKVPATLCEYAGEGLICSRAKKFIKNNEAFDDEQIERDFWLAAKTNVLDHDWKRGIVVTKVINAQSGQLETWKALQIEFFHSDLQPYIPIQVIEKINTLDKPKSNNWNHWIAELIAYYHENGLPPGVGHTGQSTIIDAIEERLIARNCKSLSRTIVQETVNTVLDRMREDTST